VRDLDIKNLPTPGQPVDVQIFPGHDQADREGISGVYNDIYGIHIVMQLYTGTRAVTEAQGPGFLALRTRILEWLMSKLLTTTNAVHNFKNSSLFAHRHPAHGVYDLVRLEEVNAFYSEIIVTYKAPGLRRQ
jgi:hypothetical protein